MIVGLAGYAGAGKDTAAQCLVERGWRQDSFAAPLKQMAYDINPWIPSWHTEGQQRLRDMVDDRGWEDAKKVPAVRQFLQNLGTAVREHSHSEAWVYSLRSRWNEAGRANTVITDVRYVNEALWTLCPFVGAKADEHLLIWIDRPGVGPVNDHISDQALARRYCTHEVINDGTPEQLWQRVLEVAEPVEFGDFILCPACKPRRRTMRWDR